LKLPPQYFGHFKDFILDLFFLLKTKPLMLVTA
jgi:hypothetical protein